MLQSIIAEVLIGRVDHEPYAGLRARQSSVGWPAGGTCTQLQGLLSRLALPEVHCTALRWAALGAISLTGADAWGQRLCTLLQAGLSASAWDPMPDTPLYRCLQPPAALACSGAHLHSTTSLCRLLRLVHGMLEMAASTALHSAQLGWCSRSAFRLVQPARQAWIPAVRGGRGHLWDCTG